MCARAEPGHCKQCQCCALLRESTCPGGAGPLQAVSMLCSATREHVPERSRALFSTRRVSAELGDAFVDLLLDRLESGLVLELFQRIQGVSELGALDDFIADGHADRAVLFGAGRERGVHVDLVRVVLAADVFGDHADEELAGAVVLLGADRDGDHEAFGSGTAHDRDLGVEELAAVLVDRVQQVVRFVGTGLAADVVLVALVDQEVVLALLDLLGLVGRVEARGKP